jgi:hypothetical protein
MRPMHACVSAGVSVMLVLLLAGDVHAQSGRPTGNIRPGEEPPPRPQPGPERPARITMPAVPAPVQQPEVSPPSPFPGGTVAGPPLCQPPVIFSPVIIVQDPVIIDGPASVRPTCTVSPEADDGSPMESFPIEVHLRNRTIQPAFAGYNFPDDQLLPWDHRGTDLYYESIGETMSLSTPGDSRIVGLGATAMVQDIGGAPGFSEQWGGTADARPGHGYVVRLWDRTLVGVRVISVTGEDVRFEWLGLGKDPIAATVSFPR